MSHVHQVIDSDIRFTIDPHTRTITDSSPTRKTIVQYDHNSEVYTFELPRYVEGHDMTLCDKVEVWFNNGEIYGKLPITDLHISSENANMVVFSWTVTRLATQHVAPLKFQFYFTCTDDDGPTYEWHTVPYKRIKVVAGLGNDAALDLIDEQIREYVEQRGYEVPAVTYMLVDEAGNEIPAVLVEEEVELTATANDIRLGTTAVTNEGVTEGEKEIPSYYVAEGYRVVPVNSRFIVPHTDYDYTKFQAVVCKFRENVVNSVESIKVALENYIYDVGSTIQLSQLIKDETNTLVDFGIINDTDSICVIRYFMYKEMY